MLGARNCGPFEADELIDVGPMDAKFSFDSTAAEVFKRLDVREDRAKVPLSEPQPA